MTNGDGFYRNLLDNLFDGVYFVDRDRTITYWNKGAERITGHAAADMVGRNCADNLLVHVDEEGRSLCRGRCPLTESLEDGCLHRKDVYLLHKNGHRIPVSVRVSPLRDLAGNTSGAVEIFSDNTSRETMAERLAEVEKMAYLDPLTGLANRRYMEITLASRDEEKQRYGWLYGAIFIDIDDFKKINDRYGHDTGDEVLKMVARTIAHSSRSFDVVGRWGGEEFLAVIANVSSDELIRTANRFRALVEHSRLPGKDHIQATISLGAALARPDETKAELLKRADQLLYRSKQEGKNRVTSDCRTRS